VDGAGDLSVLDSFTREPISSHLSGVGSGFPRPRSVTPFFHSHVTNSAQDRTFGEIDVLFEHRIPARKFKYTKADRECSAGLLRIEADEM
jgi:hypothetical protein